MTEMSHEVHRIEVEIIGLCVRIRCIATKDRRKVDFDTFSLASPVGKGSDWIAAPKPLPQVPEQVRSCSSHTPLAHASGTLLSRSHNPQETRIHQGARALSSTPPN